MRSLSAGALLACLALWSTPSTAWAVFVSSTSSSFGLSENLTLTPLVGVNVVATVGPVDPVSGSAPPLFNISQAVASFTSTVAPVETTSTGLIIDTAFGDAPVGAAMTNGTSTVNNLNLSLIPGLGAFNLTATTVFSQSQVSGDFGAFTRTGTTILTNPVLTVLGVGVALASNPAPNTTIVNVGGLVGATLILNEQIPGGNGTTTASLTTNAIHLRLLGVNIAGVGSLTGDVIVADSFASITSSGAVPEPSTFCLMGIATGILGVAGVRRRKALTAPVV